MSSLLERLRHGPPLLMDAAMGTALLARGVPPLLAALTHPGEVARVHADHVAAGAEVVLTATFQAHAAGERVEELCRRALELARGAGARYVLGDVGPLPAADLPRVAEALDGADGLLLETFSSPAALELAALAFHRLTEVPVFLSLAYERVEGRLVTHSGHAPETYARHAARHGVAALGVNCGRDVTPDDIAEVLRRYRSACDLPLFARPNAGSPGRVAVTPEAFAAAVPGWGDVAMVGGCCGTTAAHVAALRGALRPG